MWGPRERCFTVYRLIGTPASADRWWGSLSRWPVSVNSALRFRSSSHLPQMRRHLFTKESDEDAALWNGKVSSITICMVRFVLYNTSQHFVSREGITFACGFILKSDWLLLNLWGIVQLKLYGSATRPLSDFRMGPGNKATVPVYHLTCGAIALLVCHVT